MRIRTIIFICIASSMTVTLAFAQSRFRSPFRGGRNRLTLRSDYPTWKNDPEFENDVFTFVRIQYDSDVSYGSYNWWDRWDNDYPDGDMNFSFRLHQLTSIEVAPNPKLLRLTDSELSNYPFIYMEGVQKMVLSGAEQRALRKYLLNGGFVMLDDFWSPEGWNNVYRQMRGVFPDREPKQLTLNHEIFHIVFDLKKLPQVTDIQTWRDGYHYEFEHGPSGGDEGPHFWAYFDDNGRMAALLCHNNDLGDGWEQEGENEDYFHEYSEKCSYPMGINVIIYALTH